MPVAVVLVGAGFEIGISLAPDFVEGMEEEAAAAAGGVENIGIMGDGQHVHDQLHDGARSEVLAEVAPEEGTHERLESAALAVEVGIGEVDAFKVTDDGSGLARAEADVVLEDFRVFLAALLVEFLEAFEQLFFGDGLVFLGEDLEVVGFAGLTGFAFVPEFAEDEFVEFVKRL